MTEPIKGRRPRVPVEPGQRFGDWLVLEVGPHIRAKTGQLAMRCECTLCGSTLDVAKASIIQGRSLRCRPCAARQSRAKAPGTTNAMVLTGAINRLPKLDDEQLANLLAAAVAERDRREFDW